MKCSSYPGVTAHHLEPEDAIELSVPEEYKDHLDLVPTTPDPVEIGEWNSDWRLPVQRLHDIYSFITGTVIPRFSDFELADKPDDLVRLYKATSVHLG
jgi:hypothetical protein